MVSVVIYTRDGCPYCHKAVELLASKNVEFTELNCSQNSNLRAEMNEKSGRNTFPQIFIGAKHVGGCDDLHALEHAGALDPLLAG